MSLATDLRALATAEKAEDKLAIVYAKLTANLTAMATQGYTETDFVYPLWLTEADREKVRTDLTTDGFIITQNPTTGFLHIVW
jgi:hypothetical protein